jgi:hypothetical protein
MTKDERDLQMMLARYTDVVIGFALKSETSSTVATVREVLHKMIEHQLKAAYGRGLLEGGGVVNTIVADDSSSPAT